MRRCIPDADPQAQNEDTGQCQLPPAQSPEINSWVWRCSSQRQHEGHNDGREQHGLNADEENDIRHIGRRHRRGRRAAMDDALRSLRRLAKIAAERSAAWPLLAERKGVPLERLVITISVRPGARSSAPPKSRTDRGRQLFCSTDPQLSSYNFEPKLTAKPQRTEEDLTWDRRRLGSAALRQ